MRFYIRSLADPDAWYPTQEAKRVRLTVMIAHAGTVIEAVWSLTLLAAGPTYWRSAALNAFAALTFSLIPLLQRTHNLRLVARVVLLTMINCWLFTYANLYAGKNGTQYCFLPMTSMPFIIFDTRTRFSTTYGVFLPLILFIALEMGHFGFLPPEWHLPTARWTYWMSVGTAFAMSFLAIYFYRQVNEQFEHQLRESQGRFVRIVEAAQEGIVVCSNNGRISYANPALAQALGISQQNLVARSVMDFVAPPYRQVILDNVLHLRRAEVEFVRPDGKRLMTWMSTSPLHSDRPESKAHIGLILDITEAMERERLLEQQRSQMLSNAKLSALGEMAAGIAHEIYNPLTAIRLATGMLQRFFASGGRDFRKAQAVAGQMEVTIERIVRIIEGLKDFSRENGIAAPSDVPLVEIIEDTLSLCRERFRANGIQLTVARVPSDLIVHVRPIQISQVLLNLLNNAFQAVSGQRDRRVVIGFRVEDDRKVEVSVSDNGPGIPEEIRDRIFQPFFTTKPAGSGTGLGLSISKGIVESAGGSLHFQSVPGMTTFTFTVSLQRGSMGMAV